MNTLSEAVPSRGLRSRKLAAPWHRFRYALAIYATSRCLYLLVAVVASLVRRVSISTEFSNWDGHWYVLTAERWYTQGAVAHYWTEAGHYSTLGFLPLFPMLEWLLGQVLQLPIIGCGIALSLIFGASATLLVTELARQWWGAAAARRALLFWCFFPGTVVFSMIYTEGLLITLVAGCFMLLARKRWLWAGLLAGLATAVGPVAVAVIPACAAAAALEIRERGWTDKQGWRSLLAPLLSPFGLIGFGIFLWFWTGSPLSSFQVQHGAWSETTTPLAIPDVFGSLIHQIFISGSPHGPGGIDLNGVLALLGTAFLFFGLWKLWKVRHTIPIPVWVWTVFAALLALTSAKTPPNPRLLICMFPVVLIVGSSYEGRSHRRLMVATIVCLLLFTPLTFVGYWLRP